MLSSVTNVVKSIFRRSEESRKRNLERMNGEDEDEFNLDLHKRQRRFSGNEGSSLPTSTWNRVASWVTRTKVNFQDSFYFKTVSDSVGNAPTQQDITLYSTSTSRMDNHFQLPGPSGCLQRRPLERSAYAESLMVQPESSGVKLKPVIIPKEFTKLPEENGSRSDKVLTTSHATHPFSIKKTLQIKPASRSKTKNPVSYMSVYDKLYNKGRHSSSMLENKRIWNGSTVKQSIRLEEREQYRQLLQQYTTVHLAQPDQKRAIWKKSVSLSSINEHTELGTRIPVMKEKLDKSYGEHLKQRCISVFPNSSGGIFKPTNLPTNGSKEVIILSESSTSSSGQLTVLQTRHSVNTQRHSLNVIDLDSSVSGSCHSRHSSLSSDTEDKENPISDVILNADVTHNRSLSAFKSILDESPLLSEKWLKLQKQKADERDKELKRQIVIQEAERDIARRRSEEFELTLNARFQKHCRLHDSESLLEEFEDLLPIEELPELTPEILEKVENALQPSPPGEILVECFGLRITRRDMNTLDGYNWLNDEVINFYMNLLMERGKMDNFPSVYACNTFFYSKLVNGGHAALRRWTRKVDIFAHKYMVVPVHLGVHWCLAVIDFSKKTITYYDSMGGHNNKCLESLWNYLQEESLDKKKHKFDMSDWTSVNAKNIPLQQNGCDCGMFTCKYAEYITRDAKVTFTQEMMPYFRKRMVYEILSKELM